MQQQTVCGTVTAIKNDRLEIEVRRESACVGCQASGACHSFSKPEMQFELEAPKDTLVTPGDHVIIALSGDNFLKACLIAFGIPLLVVLACLLVAQLMGVDQSIQAWVAIGAFVIGLVPVRILGRDFASPRVIEVIHEQG